ncbi:MULTISPECIES: DUF167 domain-containing protein [Sinorhizobium]|uniref:UPF0235 protein ATY31_23475 n=2 Tax=Sinorhizobium TaxID=28105 RepID=A0A2S3YIT3_9HYPH|nr:MULTISPECIES: DUF167 domain-containing protein [Sinorhizobium]AUX78108.1 hypothetical protein NXT3_CH03581 [Sinorhizobium fredii]PDT41075.1 hypothetical protein CO656_13705 [Sinorhizobium sp. FG01]PDT51833.1 hypothetical protein CO664_18485 [Sinorhizobium sp. NG07B]POH26903.1 hypothetical protein ATY31_23475 [Sinorhizobium americanum]POH27154.1 hypothetical protein ATY30_22990 [Sinorhizobium americanum]
MGRRALAGFGDHARLAVRLTPNGGRDAIDGLETAADGEEHLKVRVRAVPEKGKANQALIALLAQSFGIARNRISLVSGATQRKKILRIEADPEVLQKRLAEIAGAAT